MEAFIHILEATSTLFWILMCVFSLVSYHRDWALWAACCAVVFLVVAGFAWYQNVLWMRDKEDLEASANQNKKAVASGEQETVELPKFSEDISEYKFSYGQNIIMPIPKASLNGVPTSPGVIIFGQDPIKVYVKNGHFMADVDLGVGDIDNPRIIKLRGNQVTGRPENWDMNYNDYALEIVDDQQKPVFQFYYKTKGHIVVKGVFPFEDGKLLIIPDGQALISASSKAPTSTNFKYTITRLFKYPFYAHPHETAD